MASITKSSVKGLTALVTGGCSGLGAATVKRLVAGGAKVLAVDVAGEGNVASLGPQDRVKFVKADITDEAAMKSAFSLVKKEFGRLDAVVNCAGIGIAVRTYNFRKNRAHSLEHFERVIKVNTVGTFNVCRLGAGVMGIQEPDSDNQRGVIINTSSVAATEGQIGQVAYSASKGALVAMTLPMARDLSDRGIRVVTIAPGLFDTPLLSSLPQKVRDHLARTVPNPSRLGNPSEFAQLVETVILNHMVNGAVLRLDGALRMMP